MSLYRDRVKDTATTTGTGSFTLAGSAPTGFQTFATAFGASAVYVPYAIVLQGGSEWEVGYGTLSSSTTLARTTVLASSNSGSAVSFSAGTKDVFCTIPAEWCNDVPQEHFQQLVSNYALTSTTSQQQLLNTTTNGRLTLRTGIYNFRCSFYITGLSSTSGNGLFSVKGAGTATTDTPFMHLVGLDSNTPLAVATPSGSMAQSLDSAAPFVAAGTGTQLAWTAWGSFNVSVEGTIIPSITLTTASAGSVRQGSYFSIRRIGHYGTYYNGNWD